MGDAEKLLSPVVPVFRPNGSFVLYLSEGEHRIEINNPDSYSVKSIMFDSRDLMKSALKLEGPVSSNIEITLAPR